MRYFFPKKEKLCGKNNIAKLYGSGKHFTCYPLRVTWLAQSSTQTDVYTDPQVLIWAPKSLFKRAVKRNKLRRLIRETYRLNSTSLKDKLQANHQTIHIAFNYIAKEEYDFDKLNQAMKKAIDKLSQL